MEGRSRLSRGSVEWQTAQEQPIVGTPELVPEPSTVIFRPHAFAFRFGLLRLHEAEAQFGDGIIQSALLFGRSDCLWSSPAAWPADRYCAGQVEIRLLFLAEGQQSQIQFGLEAERIDQKIEIGGGKFGTGIVAVHESG